MKKLTLAVMTTCGMLGAATVYAQSDDPAAWDPQAAAAYLDQRLEWWSGWENAARERGTFCISCHTTGPYGLARPMLRSGDAADTPTQHEQTLLTSVTTRVTDWEEIGPFYTDERYGSPKTSESRGTEAIFNALILARRDSVSGTLSKTAERAFDHLWALQQTSGQAEGAWPWLHFNLAPWESDEGTYHGAALAAVAVGLAPDEYLARPEIHDHVARLRDYLRRRVDAEPPFTRVMAVWAETALPGTLTFAQQAAIIDDVVGRQRPDGGWSLSSLGSWERRDDTAVDQTSDGYATGLVTLALRTAGQPRAQAAIARGLVWLDRNQRPDGSWPATSLNRQHDPASERAGFMRDAATAYAVLALTAHKDD